MKKTLKTLRSRVGRIMRDVERQLDGLVQHSRAGLEELIGHTKQILSQKQKEKNKLYALHAPEVECLAKGKARKPYEFGVKVSITTTRKEGLVVGARSMPGNPYDGHTLAEALEQASILSAPRAGLRPARLPRGTRKLGAARRFLESEVQARIAVVDRGYKGVAIDGVKILSSGFAAWHHTWLAGDDPAAQRNRAGHRSYESRRQA